MTGEGRTKGRIRKGENKKERRGVGRKGVELGRGEKRGITEKIKMETLSARTLFSKGISRAAIKKKRKKNPSRG